MGFFTGQKTPCEYKQKKGVIDENRLMIKSRDTLLNQDL